MQQNACVAANVFRAIIMAARRFKMQQNERRFKMQQNACVAANVFRAIIMAARRLNVEQNACVAAKRFSCDNYHS